MRSIPLGISASPTSVNNNSNRNVCSKTSPPPLSLYYNYNLNNNKRHHRHHHHHHQQQQSLQRVSHDNPLSLSSVSYLFRSGVCRASQVVELFPTVSPEIVVREARLEDCWEVAETHCSSFFPEYSFPLDFVLRVDRLLAMLAGFSLPSGCKRTCLVAVLGSSADDACFFQSEDLKIGGFDGKFSLNRGSGIAYVSNVAVRERFRRKGIAKRLIAKAEAQARSWGCRSIALHCDLNNPSAIKLYKGRGFKCIKVPEGANWPQPKTSPDVKFHFMMKLLSNSTTP